MVACWGRYLILHEYRPTVSFFILPSDYFPFCSYKSQFQFNSIKCFFFKKHFSFAHYKLCTNMWTTTTNTTDLLLNCEILCNVMFERVCVVCVCVCVCVCVHLDCAGPLLCQLVDRQTAAYRAADWRAGHSGDSRHFTSPGLVMRDRGHRRGPADTWVTLRDRVWPSSGLFVSLSNP